MTKKSNQPLLISITPSAIIKIIAILLILYLLYLIRDLILVILTSIIIASAIEPGARFLMKRKFPRALAVISVYFVVAFVLIGTFYLFLPALASDIKDVVGSIPNYIDNLSSDDFSTIPGLGNILGNFTNQIPTTELFSKLSQTLSGATVGFLSTASSFFGGLLSFVLIVVISFYLAVQEDGVKNFLRIITPAQHEKYILDLWRRSQEKIALWMQGQLILALIIGILTFLGLSILGVPNAMFLAVVAAIFELIPIFGPILAAIPAIGFALAEGGVTLGLLTLGLYAIIQQFESQLIHPLVVRKIVGIPALIAILALIIGAKVAGFLGILISVPIAAAFMEFLNDVEKKKLLEIERLASDKK